MHACTSTKHTRTIRVEFHWTVVRPALLLCLCVRARVGSRPLTSLPHGWSDQRHLLRRLGVTIRWRCTRCLRAAGWSRIGAAGHHPAGWLLGCGARTICREGLRGRRQRSADTLAPCTLARSAALLSCFTALFGAQPDRTPSRSTGPAPVCCLSALALCPSVSMDLVEYEQSLIEQASVWPT